MIASATLIATQKEIVKTGALKSTRFFMPEFARARVGKFRFTCILLDGCFERKVDLGDNFC